MYTFEPCIVRVRSSSLHPVDKTCPPNTHFENGRTIEYLFRSARCYGSRLTSRNVTFNIVNDTGTIVVFWKAIIILILRDTTGRFERLTYPNKTNENYWNIVTNFVHIENRTNVVKAFWVITIFKKNCIIRYRNGVFLSLWTRIDHSTTLQHRKLGRKKFKIRKICFY